MKEFILKQNIDTPSRKVDYARELNASQLEVVEGGDGPCLVLAGAGSGKTRTITYRVAYLIEHGVPPEQILLLTFTNKAAREMLSRVERLLGSFPTGLVGGTFHSVANRMLRHFAHEVGFKSDFTILDQEDARSLLKTCAKSLDIDVKAKRFPSPSVLLNMVSYARNAALSLAEVIANKYPNFFDLTPTIGHLADVYRERKHQANALDFDDLLVLWRDLLETNPQIRERLSSQFRYILVDEYQDTNVVQADIVRALAQVHGNILVVGDDAQSIYSFRAAQIKNILSFPKTFPGTRTFRLVTNYRSTPQILDLANASIRNNTQQFQKELSAVVSAGERPQVIPAGSSAQEAQYVAEQILIMRADGLPMEHMAVLFRSASSSQRLEMELMKRDIPYEYRGGMKFFERAHIKDIVCHLRLAQNHQDETAWMRVLSLQEGVGPSTAEKIFAWVRQAASLQEMIQTSATPPSARGGSAFGGGKGGLAGRGGISAKARGGWERFLKTVHSLCTAGKSPGAMIRAVAAGSYREYLLAEYPDAADRLDDIEQFALFADTHDDLQKFLDEVSLTEQFGAGRASAGTVADEKLVLSTIHQAKGLEWDSVFVIGLTDGQFPNGRALAEEGGLEEERRLFYVAATRARKNLFLTYPLTSGYDTLIINRPSLFLQELPSGVCEQVRLRHAVTPTAPSWGSRPHNGQSTDWEPMIVLNDLGEKQ